MGYSEKVSIIIPVYNKEDYLDDCIQSIIRQTYTNIELILVDDGSTDFSGSICDKWKREDERIYTYHIINGGVGNARNYGMNVASGDMIMFIDADDMIKENCVERMLEEYNNHHVSMVTCGFTIYNSKEKEATSLLYGSKGKKDICAYIEEMSHFDLHFYYNGPFAKLFRKCVASENSLQFEPKDTYGEDFVFNMRLLACLDTVYTIDEPLYVYRIDSTGSLSKGGKSTQYLYNRLMLMIRLFENLIVTKNCSDEAKHNVIRFKNKIVKLIYSNIYLENASLGLFRTLKMMRMYRRLFPDNEYFNLQRNVDIKIKTCVYFVKYRLYLFLILLLRISKI